MNALVGILTLLASVLAPQDELYVLRGGNTISVLDATSGAVKRSLTAPGLSKLSALEYVNGRLYGSERSTFADSSFVEIHPASGDVRVVGSTGFPWNDSGYSYDRNTGDHYAIHGDLLYTIDPNTGSAALIDQIAGIPFYEHLWLAIDDNGLAIGVGRIDRGVWAIDLTVPSATLLGVIQLGNGTGSFFDVDFDEQGQLWAVWAGLPGVGVYKIDLQAITATWTYPLSAVVSIATGPSTPEAPYCSAKTNSLGCVPDLASSGLASESASSGYEVTVSNVHNHTLGRLLYGTSGAASNPFAGGVFCVAAPWKGTKVVTSGGSPKPAQDCTGVWSFDLNTQFTNKPGPSAGDTIHCQWIGRDRGFAAPDNYALSSALQFTLLP